MPAPIGSPLSRVAADSPTDISLIDYLRALWQVRVGVAALIATSVIAGGLWAWSTPRVYEASATLMVARPKTGQSGSADTSVASFVTLLQNRSLAARAIEKFSLDRTHRLSPNALLEGHLRAQEVPGTNVLRLAMRLGDPTLAAEVANFIAEASLDLNRRISGDEAVALRDYIGQQVEQTRTRLTALEAQLVSYKREAQLDVLKSDIDTLLNQRSDYLNLLVEIEAEKARLAKAESERTERPQLLTVNRTDREDANSAAGSGTSASSRGSALQSQVVNPVYEVLDQEVATTRATLEGLDRRRLELAKQLQTTKGELPKLNALYEREVTQAKLQMEYDLATKLYAELFTRFEQANIDVASRTTTLQIVDRAYPPDRPIAPRPTLMMVTALGLGVGAALLLGLLQWLMTSQGRTLVARREHADRRAS